MINNCPKFSVVLRGVIIALCIGMITAVFFPSAYAASGIESQINFQGKLVNSDGTNVTDGSYTVKFGLYNDPSLGSDVSSCTGNCLWTETDTVTTSNGVFRVSLGATTSLATFNFDQNPLYLGVTVNSDSEMTPRVLFTAAPYAFDAQKVAGLTVTDTTGTLTIPNGTTVQFGGAFTTSGASALTLTTTGTTNVTLPTTGTLITNTESANQTVTSTQTTGTAFSIADSTALTGAITGLSISLTGANAQNQTGLAITMSGATGTSLNALTVSDGSNTNVTLSKLGILTLGSASNNTGQLVLAGTGGSGTSTFQIGNQGSTNISYTFPTTAPSNNTILQSNSSGVLSWVAASGLGTNYWALNSGILTPATLTNTLSIGVPNATTSLGTLDVRSLNGTQPIATFSGATSFAGLVVDNSGKGDIFTASSSGLNRFVITQNGNVGIGIANPTTLLDVNGTALVQTPTNSTTAFEVNNSLAEPLFVVDTSTTNNLITNPGFEAGTTGWSAKGSATISQNVSKQHVYAGQASLKIVTTATAQDGALTNSFTSSVTAGTYELSFYAKMGSGTLTTLTAGYTIGITSTSCTLNSTTINASGYQRYSCTISPGSTITNIYISQGTTASANTIYIDAVQLVSGSSLSPYQLGAIQLRGVVNSPAVFQSVSNSTTAFQIQNTTASDNLFVADTLDEGISIGSSTTPLATLDTRSLTGTTPIASFSGATSFAGLVVDNSGKGDIFTASSSGLNRFVISQAGNVGVGTTAPSQLLQISGGNILLDNNQNIDFKDSGGTSRQVLTYTGSNTLEFVNPKNNSNMSLELTSASSNGNFNIWTSNTERFRIDSGGDIGINTQAPLGILDVRGVNGTNAMSGTIPIASFSGQTSFAGLVVDNSGLGDLFTASSSGLNRFVITQAGNVGIGLTNPTNPLSVLGNISDTTYAGANAVLYAAPTTGLFTTITTTTANQCLVSTTGASGTPNWGSCSAGTNYWALNSGILTPATLTNTLSIGVPNATTSLGTLDVRSLNGTQPIATFSGATSFAGLVVDNSGKGDIFTASSSGLNRFVITQNGNVGIGKTAPGATLDILGPTSEVIGGTAIDALDVVGGIGGGSGVTGGTGGAINLTGGGGAVSTGTGGTGGVLALSSGAGGGGVTSGNGGAGGNLTVGAGNGGIGGTTSGNNGAGGFLSLAGGNGGTRASRTGGDGGDVYVVGGAAGGTGANGDVILAMTSGGTAIGKVGIGTTTTTGGLLTVAGDIATTQTTINLLNATATTVNFAGAATTLTMGASNGVTVFNGKVGIGASPTDALDVRGTTGTIAVATFSAKTSFATLVINNDGVGDLLTASASSQTHFTVNNAGVISTASVGTGSMRTATGSQVSSTNAAMNVTMNDYSFSPSVTCSAGNGAGMNDVPEADPGNTIAVFRLQTCGSGNVGTVRWRYITASDHPTIWTVVNSDGTLAGLIWEAEDPQLQTGYPTNSNPLKYNPLQAGQYFLSPNPASIDQLKVLYGKLPTKDVIGISSNLRDYLINQRHWLDNFISLDDLATISDRYQPAAREWALRFVAQQYNISPALAIRLIFHIENGQLITNNDPYGQIQQYNAQVAQSQKQNSLSPNAKNADLAEWYKSNGEAKPGDIVSIGTKGMLLKSTVAYDQNIAGVVSTSPNTTMGNQTSDSDIQLALSGKVPVNVSTENGDIQQGDYLTSSSIPGVAMRATKAGKVIGQALESYTSSGPGQILILIQNTQFGGVYLNSSGLTSSDNVNVHDLIELKENINTSGQSQLYTDRLTAGLVVVSPKVVTDALQTNTITSATSDNIAVILPNNGLFTIGFASTSAGIQFDNQGNAMFTGTLTADKIKANKIEGLEIVTSKITQLDNTVATLSANLSVLSASTSAISGNTSSLSAITVEGLTVTQNATVTANFRVKGDGLFEGILSVIDTLKANNFIVTGLSDFFNIAIFHNNVSFEGRPTFNQDTAGFAVIKKNADHVDINFDSEYATIPVVNTTLTLDAVITPTRIVGNLSVLQQQLLNEGYYFVITNKSTKGFTIQLNKAAKDDIEFSWTALAVKDAKTFESNKDIITPTPLITPSANDSLNSNIATSAGNIQ